MAVDFEIWFRDNLKISAYPADLLQSRSKEYDVVINVSDEFYMFHQEDLSMKGYSCYWFPLGQSSRDMGVVSIFGALHVLYRSYLQNKKVRLHCRKGGNRSQTVRVAFYYMVQSKHFELDGYRNKLIQNCQENHLPEVGKMERWLKRCKVAFDNWNEFKGNMLDWTFLELGLKGDDFFQTNFSDGKLVHE